MQYLSDDEQEGVYFIGATPSNEEHRQMMSERYRQIPQHQEQHHDQMQGPSRHHQPHSDEEIQRLTPHTNTSSIDGHNVGNSHVGMAGSLGAQDGRFDPLASSSTSNNTSTMAKCQDNEPIIITSSSPALCDSCRFICIAFCLLFILVCAVAVAAFVVGNYLGVQQQACVQEIDLAIGQESGNPFKQIITTEKSKEILITDEDVIPDIGTIIGHWPVGVMGEKSVEQPDLSDVYPPISLERFYHSWGLLTPIYGDQVKLFDVGGKKKQIECSFEHQRHESMLEIEPDTFLRPNSEYELDISFDTTIICPYQRKKDQWNPGNSNGENESYMGESRAPGYVCWSRLKDSNSSSEYEEIDVLATRFEPDWARTLVPCFDEPAMKAIFNVTVRHEREITVITNGAPINPNSNPTDPSTIAFSRYLNDDVSRMTWPENYVTTHFTETPPMSTYLLSLTLGDFRTHSMQTERGLPVNLFIRKSVYLSEYTYALEFATQLMDKLEKYFEMRYPFPKLDLVAVPHYGAAGMENWATVMFDETAIHTTGPGGKVPTPMMDAHSHRQSVRDAENVLAHELVHQWFGNLVTCKWWDDVWIQEGTTTHIAAKFFSAANDETQRDSLIAYQILPRLHVIEQSSSSHKHIPLILPADAASGSGNLPRRLHSRPNFMGFTDPSLMVHFAESNAYIKGATFVNALYNLLGETKMRSGLAGFLKKFAFDSATTSDFLRSLGGVTFDDGSEHDMEKIMTKWLYLPGLPEVHFDVSQNPVTVSQRQANRNNFRSYIKTPEKSENVNARFLPILFLDASGNSGKAYVEPVSQGSLLGYIPITMTNTNTTEIDHEKWFLANVNISFPMRVNYDKENWLRLKSIMCANPNLIPELSRLQIYVDSSFFHLEGSVENMTFHFSLLRCLAVDGSNLVQHAGIRLVHRAMTLTRGTKAFRLLAIYLRPISESVVDRGVSMNHYALLSYDFSLSLVRLMCAASMQPCAGVIGEVPAAAQLTDILRQSDGMHAGRAYALCNYVQRYIGDEKARQGVGGMLAAKVRAAIKWDAGKTVGGGTFYPEMEKVELRLAMCALYSDDVRRALLDAANTAPDMLFRLILMQPWDRQDPTTTRFLEVLWRALWVKLRAPHPPLGTVPSFTNARHLVRDLIGPMSILSGSPTDFM